jgi:dihydrofolate reductase
VDQAGKKEEICMSRKTVLYIAASLDGYIAAPGDDLSFLSPVQREGEDYGYGAFVETVDTVVMGRKTYDWVMGQVPEFPHADKTAYIITRRPRPPIGNTYFYNGSLKDLFHRLKSEPGKNIFIDGGAEIVNELLRDRLIDEIILSVIPVLLGAGTRLFQDGRPGQKLEFIEAKGYESGLLQIRYKL